MRFIFPPMGNELPLNFPFISHKKGPRESDYPPGLSICLYLGVFAAYSAF